MPCGLARDEHCRLSGCLVDIVCHDDTSTKGEKSRPGRRRPQSPRNFLTSRPLEEAGREGKKKKNSLAGDGNASGADERHATRRRAAGTPASIEHGKAVPGRWGLVAEGAGAPAPSLLFPTAQLNGFRAKERWCGGEDRPWRSAPLPSQPMKLGDS